MAEPVVLVSDQPWRIGLCALGFLALFGVLGLRLHHLQVTQGENLAQLGERQRLRTMVIQAPRGNIYDAGGVPLAVSDGKWTVYADPGYMDDRLRATVELSRLLDLPRADLRKHFESRLNGRRLARGLDDEQAEAIKALKLTGVYVRREFMRIYPEAGLAPHVLGFLLDDGSGGAGIEQEFDRVLSGLPGKETLMVDALGNPSLVDGESRTPKPGAHIQLSIDTGVQRLLEQALAEGVAKHRPKNAAGIVLVPGTGEILAMASWPDFDVARLDLLDPQALRNNAVAFVYEPGSTMKPLIAGAAVAERLTNWQESLFCENGRWTFRSGRSARTVTDHSVKHGGHQNLTVTQGIALSDNILMAKLGVRMGPARLHDWVTAFSFGRQTGLSLPGEDGGIMLSRARWSIIGSCLSIPMGHEVAVTPLQMALAHAAIANGGTWLPPRLIKRIHTPDSDLAPPALAEKRRLFSPGDAARIEEAMTHTMTEGTGKGATLDGYSSAGKTGTTEKLVNGRYSKSNHIGSFVCWAPARAGASDKLLALVVIDDPTQNGHYGSETAAPLVQKVLQGALALRGIQPDQPREVKPVEPAGVAAVSAPKAAAKGVKPARRKR